MQSTKKILVYVNLIPLNYSQVLVNELQLDQALWACRLHDKVSLQTLHNHVKRAAAAMSATTISNTKKKSKEGMIVKVIPPASDNGPGSTTTDTSPLTMSSSGYSTGIKKKRTRRTARQVSEARIQEKFLREDYSRRFKQAFREGTRDLARIYDPESNTPPYAFDESAHVIVDRLNETFCLDGKRKLSRSTLYRAIEEGRVGQSPLRKGPRTKIPDVLLNITVTHAEVSQVGNSGELRGRDFKRLLGAAVMGTDHDSKFTAESAWRKLRREFPERLAATKQMTMEETRAKWTTHDNLKQWFDDGKIDLVSTGLVFDKEIRGEDGALISELDFRSDEVTRRIINMDETHHDLSITGDKGGSRAVVYHNPNFQRGYKRTVKAGRHVTGAYATNAAGEALPPMFIFDSGAKIEDNFRVKLSWLEGLPVTTGRFGCPTIVETASFYAVRARGSMDDSLFVEYIEKVVLPLFPNISNEQNLMNRLVSFFAVLLS